jgi:hypothetical protein
MKDKKGTLDMSSETRNETGQPALDLLVDAEGKTIDLSGELRVHLDDLVEARPAPEGWIHLASVREVGLAIMFGNVVELSLDSDLASNEEKLEIWGRGYQVIDFLENQEAIGGASLWPRDGITIHTANSDSRDKMKQAIETIPRRHPHLRVREAEGRPASQPKYFIEPVEDEE